jgi:hypothetical protein
MVALLAVGMGLKFAKHSASLPSLRVAQEFCTEPQLCCFRTMRHRFPKVGLYRQDWLIPVSGQNTLGLTKLSG